MSRKAEVSEYQHPVRQRVEEVGNDCRDQSWPHDSHRLLRLSQRPKKQKGKDAGQKTQQILTRQRNDLRTLTDQIEPRTCKPQQPDGRDAEQEGESDTTLKCAYDTIPVPCAVCLGDERVKRHEQADRHREDSEAECRAQSAGRERLFRDAPEHHRVDGPQKHHAYLSDHNRRGQPNHRTHFGAAFTGEFRSISWRCRFQSSSPCSCGASAPRFRFPKRACQ